MSYIKPEPEDDGFTVGSHNGGDGLLSRATLTRGFSSFEDGNMASSMIDESDLLDLEGLNSPELNPYNIHTSVGPQTIGSVGMHPGTSNHNNNNNNNNSNAQAVAASIGFSTTPSRSYPINASSSLRVSHTPPVHESTSPFDDFMLANSSRVRQPSQLQHQSYASPHTHAQRFLQDNGLHSNSSTPVGSLDNYGSSPSSFGKISKSSFSSSLPPNMSVEEQQMLMAERRRRKRESHNAVERRRRNNINEKIRELSEILPESFLNIPNTNGDGFTTLPKDDKPNKGTILSKSVDYIRSLQQIIDDQNRREIELQKMIQQLQIQSGQKPTQFKGTSAESALAKIGVGPNAANDGAKSQQSPQTSSQLQTSEVTPEYSDFSNELDFDYYNKTREKSNDNIEDEYLYSSPR